MMQQSHNASFFNFFFFLNCDTLLFPWLPHCPDVAGDLDSQTIEVLASWMLEHPLSEEQQAAESPRPEGVPDTPSPDGPETVQCPERPTSQPSERSVKIEKADSRQHGIDIRLSVQPKLWAVCCFVIQFIAWA